jgi:hypothetical protein
MAEPVSSNTKGKGREIQLDSEDPVDIVLADDRENLPGMLKDCFAC